ncbi:MAG TPA: hypothetical protein VM537_26580 [Anaerolineae bacterium]|nr:hypothetical protein [Anaerolineae bacterium]
MNGSAERQSKWNEGMSKSNLAGGARRLRLLLRCLDLGAEDWETERP